MKTIKILVVALTIVGLAGCGKRVQTTKTVYQGDGHLVRGTISVVAVDPKVNDSLSFGEKKKTIENELIKQGYSPVSIDQNPTFTAFVSYGIDNGKTEVSSVPIFGQTGGGTTYHSGSVNSYGSYGSYSGSSYTMPTYGVVGSSTVSSTYYSRNVDIDIVLTSSLSDAKPKKMYEIRAKSVGSCSSIDGVFDVIIEAVFKEFPGENGKTNRVILDWDGSC